MSRRALLFWIFGSLVFVALAAYFFAQNVEWETYREKGKMSLEARRNPYLATERFLARMGRETRRIKNPSALDSLPEGGVLVLANERDNAGLYTRLARSQAILNWVERGGYLILERDRGTVENDLLLEPFEVMDNDNMTERPGIVRHERDMDAPS
ncbi:MAG: DUF4350 domain-containing protein, partial [Zoogloeaceae bacterium]|nr:DUF4350 domain-containing protein [Zoogloeaceae bacterium]